MRRALVVMGAGAALVLALGWLFAARIPTWFGSTQTSAAAPPPAAAESPGRKIQATLFYVSEDGNTLVGVAREVPFAEGTADQARRLIEEQLRPAPPPYAPPLPPGTAVQTVFVTERNEAYVDLSPEVATRHPGGSLDELFSVYAIVNALTVNLPAIERVQILVDGKEVDSLAGHVDLRRPLPKNLTWVARPADGAPATSRPPAAPAADPRSTPEKTISGVPPLQGTPAES
jgi:hypothetical protein